MSDLTLFPYAALDANTASEVRAATERIKLRMKRTAEDIVAIGQDLIAVKDRLPHGQFGAWLESEFEMSYPTANNFMNVAKQLGDKVLTVRDLPIRAIYALAAPSTPEPVRQEVIARVEAGETVTATEIQDLKRQLAQVEQAKNQMEEEWAKAKYDAAAAQAEMKAAKAELEAIEASKAALAAKIDALQNQPPETVEVIREVIPEGFASTQDAINAAKAELAKLNAERKAVVEKVAEYEERAQRIRQEEAQLESEAATAKANRQVMFELKHDILSLLSRNTVAKLQMASNHMTDATRQDLAVALDSLRVLVRTVEDILQDRPIAVTAQFIDV